MWRSATKHSMPAPPNRASASESATASLVRKISIIVILDQEQHRRRGKRSTGGCEAERPCNFLPELRKHRAFSPPCASTSARRPACRAAREALVAIYYPVRTRIDEVSPMRDEEPIAL